MFGLSTLYAKLIGGVLAALVLAGLVADRGRWMHRAHGDEAQLSTICGATRAAAENQKLACKDVPDQIAALGNDVSTLKTAIADQNAKVTALGQESAKQQADAHTALQAAQGRASAAEAAAERLEASSHAVARPGEPQGQFSPTFEESWP